MNKPAERIKPQNGWQLMLITEEYTAYRKGEYFALSSIVQVQDEHLPLHWCWLVSFSKQPYQVVSNKEIKQLLKDFNAEDFEEDNHEKGVARKFWQAVDPQNRKPCPCKDEIIITEGDFKYSIKKAVTNE